MLKLKKTPISYYLSKKTVALYERLLKYEEVSLPKYIYLLTALTPGDECPPPYSEVLAISDYLIVSEQNYIIFFKEADANNNNQKKYNWSDYCQKKDSTREYDGINKYSCFFSDLKLRDAYEEFRKIQYVNPLLKKQLPGTNQFDNFNDTTISYEWQGSSSIKILVVRDNESDNLSFNEHSMGTSLEVTEETQY